MNPKLTPLMSLVVRPGDTEEMIDRAIEIAEEHKWIETIHARGFSNFPAFLTDKDIATLSSKEYEAFPTRSIYSVMRFQTALKQIRKQIKNGTN
jgi:hypothetical protein